MKGEVDPTTGFVVDLKDLKEILNREVIDALDHRHLNKEVPEFARPDPDDREPGHRHLAAAGEQVERRPAAPRARVRIARSVRRFLRRSMKAHLTRRYIFSASHRLHADSLTRGAESRGLWQVQQPVWARSQLCAGGDGQRTGGPSDRHGLQPG